MQLARGLDTAGRLHWSFAAKNAAQDDKLLKQARMKMLYARMDPLLAGLPGRRNI